MPGTRVVAGHRHPIIVNGPGHKFWACATFIPVVAPTTLRDQVAMHDGGTIALFTITPTWHVLHVAVR